jgi:hypothetical protein
MQTLRVDQTPTTEAARASTQSWSTPSARVSMAARACPPHSPSGLALPLGRACSLWREDTTTSDMLAVPPRYTYSNCWSTSTLFGISATRARSGVKARPPAQQSMQSAAFCCVACADTSECMNRKKHNSAWMESPGVRESGHHAARSGIAVVHSR